MQFVDALVRLAQMLQIHPKPLLRRLVIVEEWHNNIPDVVDSDGNVILPFKAWADSAFARLARMGVTIIQEASDPLLKRIITGEEQVLPMQPVDANFDYDTYARYDPYPTA